MTDYRLGPVVRERAQEGTWVGLLPQGPILLLTGAGEAAFEELEAADGPLGRDHLVEAVQARFEDAPENASALITRFLEELVDHGLLRTTEAR